VCQLKYFSQAHRDRSLALLVSSYKDYRVLPSRFANAHCQLTVGLSDSLSLSLGTNSKKD